MLQNKTLAAVTLELRKRAKQTKSVYIARSYLFQLPRKPPHLLLYIRYIYRRKKEVQKKMLQTSGRGVSEKHGTMKKKIGTHNGKT